MSTPFSTTTRAPYRPKQLLVGASAIALSVLGLAACGSAEEAEFELLEDAAMIAALSDGDGEALESADVEGSTANAAAESADEAGANAEDTTYEPDCSLNRFRQRVVEKYDDDGDGRLNEAERATLAEEMGTPGRRFRRFVRHHRRNRLQWVYDADGDGALSAEERAELRNDLEQRCINRKAFLLQRYDANDNGVMDPDEWKAAHADLRSRWQGRRGRVMDRYDANDNGKLDPAERQKFISDSRARIGDRRGKIKSRFDIDEDGSLNDEELAALKEHLKTFVRGEHFGAAAV